LPSQNGLSSIGPGWIALIRTGESSTPIVRTRPVTAPFTAETVVDPG
jgi:hypothetical protein